MNKIPKPMKTILKPIYNTGKLSIYKLLDMYDFLSGNKNPLIPPRDMIFIGDGDYKKIGEEFFSYFKELGGLKPNHKVLDVGCGIGRMSVPLTKYLSQEGQYHGFDIVRNGIDWCTQNISGRYPNFHYTHSNIYNKVYNPGGTEKSSEYKFNYNDAFFDFIFLTSVFTHMYSEDINHYLSEISRVMKKGGRCLITLFLLNSESRGLVKKGQSTQNLIHQIDENSFAKIKDIPESSIGFNETYIIELFKKNSLMIIQPVQYGSWCGREKFKSYQDIIIAEKI